MPVARVAPPPRHTIIETARAIVADHLDLEAFHWLEDSAAIERLPPARHRTLAEHVLLRGLGRLHMFPETTPGAHGRHLDRLGGALAPGRGVV